MDSQDQFETEHRALLDRLRLLLRTSHALLELLQIHVHSLENCVVAADDLPNPSGTPVSGYSPGAQTVTFTDTSGQADTTDTLTKKQEAAWNALAPLLGQQPATVSTPSTPKRAKRARTSGKSKAQSHSAKVNAGRKALGLKPLPIFSAKNMSSKRKPRRKQRDKHAP